CSDSTNSSGLRMPRLFCTKLFSEYFLDSRLFGFPTSLHTALRDDLGPCADRQTVAAYWWVSDFRREARQSRIPRQFGRELSDRQSVRPSVFWKSYQHRKCRGLKPVANPIPAAPTPGRCWRF